jgi:hypothetical protein
LPVPVDLTYSEHSRFEVRASGEVTLGEIERAIAEILAHPALPEGPDVLIVADEVDQVPTTSELRVAAREIRPALDRGLGALAIVASNPFVYGVARIFSVFAESVGAEIAAFREVDDASRWLAASRRKIIAPET